MGHRVPMTTDENAGNHRLDKWLWHTRFYKSRSLASAAINGGKVHLNAERVKPAHRVRVGDRVSLSLHCGSSSGWRRRRGLGRPSARTNAIGGGSCVCSETKPDCPRRRITVTLR